MIKWIGIVCVMAGCCGMGLYQSYLVKLRYDNLLAIKRSLICLRGEIVFGKTPLPEAFYLLSKRSSGQIADFFSRLSKQLETFQWQGLSEVWESVAKEVFCEKGLEKRDLKEWLELGQTIGYLDSKMQVDTINLYLERVNQSLEVQREEKRVKIRLYHMLGVMAGLFVTIMIL